jgi:hypothetical protein
VFFSEVGCSLIPVNALERVCRFAMVPKFGKLAWNVEGDLQIYVRDKPGAGNTKQLLFGYGWLEGLNKGGGHMIKLL